MLQTPRILAARRSGRRGKRSCKKERDDAYGIYIGPDAMDKPRDRRKKVERRASLDRRRACAEMKTTPRRRAGFSRRQFMREITPNSWLQTLYGKPALGRIRVSAVLGYCQRIKTISSGIYGAALVILETVLTIS